jgi:predicted  nucleic acid-binding Zn-ribbon protein
MAKKKVEITIEEKLRALYNLQLVDTRIDEIRNVRGELPLEVEDLDAEVEGLEKRLSNLGVEVTAYEDEIKAKKLGIETSKELIKKYNEQQKNVRNNRAYESLTKEIEYQDLEIQLAEKQIKQLRALIEQKNEAVAETTAKLDERKNHLQHKKDELDAILAETQKEEELLLEKSKEYENKADERLVNAYQRIRSSVKNGLAIVSVERGASGGSFFTIPPQVQMEIAARKKIITDEHSGRILVDKELAEEQETFMQGVIASI